MEEKDTGPMVKWRAEAGEEGELATEETDRTGALEEVMELEAAIPSGVDLECVDLSNEERIADMAIAVPIPTTSAPYSKIEER